jgi:uncharacterized membrane-anchored protein YjiN (DUF445 family)
MADPTNVTPEMLELLERRLADNVGDRVERTLKVRYAGIVAAVVFMLGLAGYSWIESLVVKAIGPVSKDAERTIAEMTWQLDLARENKRKLDALVEQITTDAEAAQRRIESFQASLAKQEETFAERSVTGERLATVFVQYGNSVAPDVAQAVAEALKGQGLRRIANAITWPSKAACGAELADWLKHNHPGVPRLTGKSIKNRLGRKMPTAQK